MGPWDDNEDDPRDVPYEDRDEYEREQADNDFDRMVDDINNDGD